MNDPTEVVKMKFLPLLCSRHFPIVLAAEFLAAGRNIWGQRRAPWLFVSSFALSSTTHVGFVYTIKKRLSEDPGGQVCCLWGHSLSDLVCTALPIQGTRAAWLSLEAHAPQCCVCLWSPDQAARAPPKQGWQGTAWMCGRGHLDFSFSTSST